MLRVHSCSKTLYIKENTMKKLTYLIVMIVVLLIPISSVAKSMYITELVSSVAKSMYITERFDNMLGEVIHTLHVPSTDEQSEITIEIGSEGLTTMSFGGNKPADCKAGYYTNISFGFDAEEEFTIPFYCPDSQGNFVYSFATSNARSIMLHMKAFKVLLVKFYHNDKVIVFDLKYFRSVYNLVHMYNRLSNNK